MGGENLVIEPCIKGFYEEGTWVPRLCGQSSGEKTPAGSNYGWFIRVGNTVTIGGTLHWSSDDALGGSKIIKGIPYPSSSTTNSRNALTLPAVGNGITVGAGYNNLELIIDPGFDFIWLIQVDTAAGNISYDHNPGVLDAGVFYGFGGTYHI
tara:strand:- start:552 stop:1007 length:456 start_codon:yes stop_codon:yes gene_type:complete